MPLSPQITITPEDITYKSFDITAVSYTSSTATYTATSHTLAVGDIVMITGLAPDGYNGTYTISSVAINTFTVANTTNTALTDQTGNVYWADPTEYEYTGGQTVAYLPDNGDVSGIVSSALAPIEIAVNGKNKIYRQSTAPSGSLTVGDVWFDTSNGNRQYYWNGTAWVDVQDTAIAAAASAATAAQNTADGKNKVYRQGTTPTGTFSVGDLWFNTSSDNAISRWDGSSWVLNSLGNNALASISANKLNAGSIDASVITVSNINAGNISTGYLAAARIQAGSLDASVITAGTITASQIATGTITATQIAAGTITATQIAAGTITTDKLVAGTLTGFLVQTSSGSNAVSLVGSTNSLTFKNGGSNVGHIVPLSSNGVLMHYGASADGSGGTFPQMYVGSANVSMFANSTNGIGISTSTGIQLNASGNSINLNNQTNYTGIATGSGSTMVVVTTGSRIAYVTSSERFKDEIQYVNTTGWLDKVLAMKPITYKTSADYLTAGEPNETQYGFLAEDIADLGGGLEKAVVLDPLGDPFSLSYDRLTVFLTLAIKELKAEIDQLKGN